MRELNDEELERSDKGPSFAAVTSEQLFSAKSDGELALRVHKANPRKYLELKEEWEYLSGARKRPDSYYS